VDTDRTDSSGERTGPEMVTALIGRLIDALRGRGLSAEPFGAAMVWVANRAADPPVDDPLARTGPGLRQAVLCRADDDGRLAWWWAWTDRDGGTEYERIGPAEEITATAVAIRRVLALRPSPGR
jgi:hypothetical protein